jgi:hypothetical protein
MVADSGGNILHMYVPYFSLILGGTMTNPLTPIYRVIVTRPPVKKDKLIKPVAPARPEGAKGHNIDYKV